MQTSKKGKESHLPIAAFSEKGIEGFMSLIQNMLQLNADSQEIIMQNQQAILQLLEKKTNKKFYSQVEKDMRKLSKTA